MNKLAFVMLLASALAGAALAGGCADYKAQGPLFRAVENIPSDMALVYLYRPARPGTEANLFEAHIADADIGVLHDGGYRVQVVKVGEIDVVASRQGSSAAKHRAAITFDTRPQQAYFVRCVSFAGSSPSLLPIPPDRAAREIKDCRLERQ